MTKYDQCIERRRREYGDRFNPAGLNPAFVEYFNAGVRVRVAFVNAKGEVYEQLTGTIGITTGWIPSFLLMRRSSDHGSMYTIGPRDRIVAIFGGRRGYVPIVESAPMVRP